MQKSKLIWYPFFFAAYSVLGVLAANIGNARPEAGIRPAALTMLGAGVLFGLTRLLTRDWHRAAFVTTAWIVLFAAYGHVYMWLLKTDLPFSPTALAGSVGLVLAAAALFAATRPKVRFEAWAAPLNFMSLALTVAAVAQIAWYQFERRETPSVSAAPHVEESGTLPDIYYIILDSYTRADTLKSAYQFDNSEFLGELEDMDFNVAECAMSNYARTELSLASSLNMDYLPELDARIKPGNNSRSSLWSLIRNSAVKDYAEAHGYQTVAFATGFPWSEWDHADYYYEPSLLRGGISEFESYWLKTTAYRVADDMGIARAKTLAFNRYRERTRFALDTLSALPTRDLGGPKFVFAHLIVPHPPFVFAADGSPSDSVSFLNEKAQYEGAEYAAGYVMQVKFINREMTRIVKEIQANSKTPPIIIIQGDHGPWLQPSARRLTILNAYYLPGHEDAVAETITPVNTFRLVFNLYLGGEFDILPDQSFYSTVKNQFDFQMTLNHCRPK